MQVELLYNTFLKTPLTSPCLTCEPMEFIELQNDFICAEQTVDFVSFPHWSGEATAEWWPPLESNTWPAWCHIWHRDLCFNLQGTALILHLILCVIIFSDLEEWDILHWENVLIKLDFKCSNAFQAAGVVECNFTFA